MLAPPLESAVVFVPPYQRVVGTAHEASVLAGGCKQGANYAAFYYNYRVTLIMNHVRLLGVQNEK